MKKLMLLLAAFAVCLAGTTFADGVFRSGKLVVTAGTTNTTVSLSDNYIDFGGTGSGYVEIDRVILNHITGTGTGAVAITSSDIGVETAVVASGAMPPAGTYDAQPRQVETYTYVQNVSYTGAVVTAVAQVQTNQVAYKVRGMRLHVVQLPVSTNAVDDIYQWAVYAE